MPSTAGKTYIRAIIRHFTQNIDSFTLNVRVGLGAGSVEAREQFGPVSFQSRNRGNHIGQLVTSIIIRLILEGLDTELVD